MTAETSILPLHDFVFVKRVEAQAKTEGGIIIPDAAKEKATKAEVLAVGPGKFSDGGKRIEPSIKKGDFVLLGKYSGQEIGRGPDFILVHESEVLAIEAQ